MLPIPLHVLEVLSSSRVPQLILSLLICGVILVVVSDHRLAILAFLVQRLIVIVLLWSTIGTPLASTSMVALVAIALIYYITERRLGRVEAREIVQANRGRPFLTRLPFRMLAASLGALVTYGFVQTYHFNPLPLMAVLAVVWLVVESLLILLLADNAVYIGLGALVFTDGCRTLYAFWQPNLLVWGLLGAYDILVALTACYLHNAESAATKGQLAGGQKWNRTG